MLGEGGGDGSMVQLQRRKGGFRASAFIFVLSGLESMGFIANAVTLFTYFIKVMAFDLSGAANTLTNLMGTVFLLPILGGFVSDTYLSRFTASLLFGSIEVLGLAMMSIQAYDKKLHPSPLPCGKSSCVRGGAALMLYSSLSLMALGAGGLRGSLAAFGADQFDSRNDPREVKAQTSYFNWMVLSSILGGAVGVTLLVWISTVKNLWQWGFFISTVATLIGLVILALGKPFYRLEVPEQSPLMRIAQVIAMAIQNRKLPLPESHDDLYETGDEKIKQLAGGEEKIPHTHQFRCLDKAAIIISNEAATCTVTQVEEVKILTRMLPILASTIIMNTCLAQLQTFSVQQGSIMNRSLGKLQVPASSVPVIPLLFMSILLPIYDMLFVPFARKLTGHPSGITQLQRVGVGLVLSIVSMAVAGIVEVKRRTKAHEDPLHLISLFWLSFQYGIFGIADMFTLVGLLDFFYKEAPLCMRSLSTSFAFLSLSLGSFLSSIFVEVINAVTKRITPSKLGWLHGLDINQNNLNLFYWFLAVLSTLNFANYLYWASWYKYKSGGAKVLKEAGFQGPAAAAGLHSGQEEVQSSKAITDHHEGVASDPVDVKANDEALPVSVQTA